MAYKTNKIIKVILGKQCDTLNVVINVCTKNVNQIIPMAHIYNTEGNWQMGLRLAVAHSCLHMHTP